MPQTFIRYRHADSEPWAHRIAEALKGHFGEAAVFLVSSAVSSRALAGSLGSLSAETTHGAEIHRSELAAGPQQRGELATGLGPPGPLPADPLNLALSGDLRVALDRQLALRALRALEAERRA